MNLSVWAFVAFYLAIIDNALASPICSRQRYVSYLENVQRPRQVMYTRRGFWGNIKYDYRLENHLVSEIRHRLERQYFCCEGYSGIVWNSGTWNNCKPVCGSECPENSKCTSPNSCSCNQGYRDSGGMCEPVCSSCGKHSHCADPETCACNAGYWKLDANNDCTPICSMGCAAHSYCAAPEYCECEPGYEKTGDPSCQPICSAGCGKNSVCVAPEQCQCQLGYSKAELDESCRAICEQPSCGSNSSCIKPNVCECNEGYHNPIEISRIIVCEPVCQEGCPANARCARPDECLCDPGYTFHAASSTGIFQHCEPHCSRPCSVNGKCVAPDLCECLPGYELRPEQPGHVCEPKCSQDCTNGFCSAPERCICHSGYSMSPNSTCDPQCTMGCRHGTCTEPEVCTCAPGYQMGPNSINICEPVCEPSCEKADCLAPNMCICHLGYEPQFDQATDLPGHVCKPACEQECVNATCSAPNHCSCLEGYVYQDEQRKTVCKPHCPACEFGDCLAPGHCECWPGFESVTGQPGCQRLSTTTTIPTTWADIESTIPTTWADIESTIPTTWADSSSIDSSSELPLASTERATRTLPPAMQCSSSCKCWHEYDELGILDTPKCINICMDDHDKPCLDLTLCRCDQFSNLLVCNENNESFADSAESLETRYVCKVAAPKTLTTTTTTTTAPPAENILRNAALDSKAATNRWPLIVGCIVAACTLIAAVALLTHLYLKRRRLQAEEEDDVDARQIIYLAREDL